MTALAEPTIRLERWLFDEALPLWWTLGADHQRGGFHEAIDLHGRPTATHRRVRVQARQTFVYATAGLWGWRGPWRAAVDHGLDYQQTRYLRHCGLVRGSVDAEGAPIDDSAMLYDQAFVLLAIAAAFRAVPSRIDLPGRAHSLLGALDAAFRHDDRGFREASADHPFHADPHMHLLEAALAWSEVSSDRAWPLLADSLAELALASFIDPEAGAIREYLASNWRAAAGQVGRIFEPGHQFEWAGLLRTWGKARGRRDALDAAARLFRVGSRFGIDRVRGVAFHSMGGDLCPLNRTARLWPQTEWIKAAVVFGADARDETEQAALLAEALSAVDGLQLFLNSPVRGAWRDKLTSEGVFLEEPAPASSIYHVIGAIRALSTRRQAVLAKTSLAGGVKQ